MITVEYCLPMVGLGNVQLQFMVRIENFHTLMWECESESSQERLKTGALKWLTVAALTEERAED